MCSLLVLLISPHTLSTGGVYDVVDLANACRLAALAWSTVSDRTSLLKVKPDILCQSGGQDQERRHKKRRGEFYSIQTSLIVAALKKMLPIGLNMCTPGDQELISLAKTRYLLVR